MKFREFEGGSWRSFPADFETGDRTSRTPLATGMDKRGRFFGMVNFRGNI